MHKDWISDKPVLWMELGGENKKKHLWLKPVYGL